MPAKFRPNRNLTRRVYKKLDKALDRAVVIAQKEIQQQLSGPSSKKRLGKRTGNLRSSIKIAKSGWLKRTVGTDSKYARIHEFGGVIKAKAAKYLKFKIGTKWFSKKSVVIPARPFFRPGLKKAKKKMLKQFRNII